MEPPSICEATQMPRLHTQRVMVRIGHALDRHAYLRLARGDQSAKFCDRGMVEHVANRDFDAKFPVNAACDLSRFQAVSS
jgi:hypothetical protein